MNEAASGKGARQAVPVMMKALVRHPGLVVVAAVSVARLAGPRWWRRVPPLPVPTAELWRFRMETAYGGAGDALPERDEIVSFLRWSRDMRRWRRG